MENSFSRFKDSEHITEDQIDAKEVFDQQVYRLKMFGRDKIFENAPKVLDLGGGKAEFARYLNSKGMDCISLDFKEVAKNKKSLQVRGDIYKIPFKDNSFDIIFGGYGTFDTYVYEHDFPKLYIELARVLKPGGIFMPSLDWNIISANKQMESATKYFNLLQEDGVSWVVFERNKVAIKEQHN